MKKHLGKYILTSCLGAIVATTPVFATYSQIDNSISQAAIKNANISTNTNTYGITLSTYEIQSWTYVTQKIKVFNDGKAQTNVTWTSDDYSKFDVDPNPDNDGNYTVKFIGEWSASGSNESKIHAHWSDGKYEHVASCVVRIINGYRVTTENYDRVVKPKGSTIFKFQINNGLNPNDYLFYASENALGLTNYRLYVEDNTLCLNVESKNEIGYGRVSFWIYHRLDGSKTYKTRVTVLIAQNIVTIDQDNISARENDSVTLVPKLNDNVAAKGEVSWFSSDTSIVSVKENSSNSSVDLIFHKKSTVPAVIYCYETLATENVNFAACYVNVTDSNLVLNCDKTKKQWEYKDGGFTLSAKLDGEDISASNITWSTSASHIAGVDNTGKVTFNRLGNVTITATYTNSNGVVFSDSYTFDITGPTFKSTPSEIVELKTATPQKITATLDGTTVDPSNLIFVSSDTNVVTVDDTGQLTYVNSGEAKVHCYYKPYYFMEEYDAVTTVKLAEPALDMTLEYYETHIGTDDGIDHYLPKVYIGGVEVPYGSAGLTWEASEGLTIASNGTFYTTTKGEYTMTCTYDLGEKQVSQTVKVIAQDFFINDFDSQEPTIVTVAGTIFKNNTFQLKFWFDSTHSEDIEIISAVSSNTRRATVTNDGLVTFVGHGWCDITCTLRYVHKNGDVTTKKAIIHIHIKVWWWAWLAIGLGLAGIIALIIFLVIRKKKKKGKKPNKKDKKVNKPKPKVDKQQQAINKQMAYARAAKAWKASWDKRRMAKARRAKKKLAKERATENNKKGK